MGDPRVQFDKHCQWPMDADMQVWKYILKLNEAHLRLPYHGTVISFSSFLPRLGLPFSRQIPGLVKAVGCEMIDEQVRAIGSSLHVCGHGHQRHSQSIQGVQYVQMPVGHEDDGERQLLLVHDGKDLCAQL